MTEETRKGVEEATRVLLDASAEAVYVFGSAAEGTDRDDSDIDLAVSGLPPEGFFHAVGEAVMAVSRPIGVIDLDESNPFTEYLHRKGKLVRVA
jgi:predicted nucleotidyltransferase